MLFYPAVTIASVIYMVYCLIQLTTKQSSERTLDISFSAEVGANYQISEDLGLSLKMDYIQAIHETEIVVNTIIQTNFLFVVVDLLTYLFWKNI